MKKLYGLALIAAVGLLGCLKNNDVKQCTPKTVESEKAAMTKFAADSAINVTVDPSGLMYEVITPGTGATPTLTSTVTAKYVGRYVSTGQQFDASADGVSFPLGNVIQGWQLGIPKIKEGGKIKLIIPSSLAYGCAAARNPYTGQVTMPPDQVLYFFVELTKVQ
ncbi:FKBP-type peptidyl-prolyl cis-trans isomerase [Niabella sp. CC-SYL272]|uniref:FKBP-type peptidyl-prolyl cis-trans isomerase n=1 Tax=Niabella agricola TaxID=2891571 RepID=UPI001F40727E|nr:FKBP-type peptidyl-prolyl cis-trans isomerase [Niabella agricola]MCF3109774.1 FKBP-type peptidyl-prolyl cis-trans isomerase [Niabella agricola]